MARELLKRFCQQDGAKKSGWQNFIVLTVRNSPRGKHSGGLFVRAQPGLPVVPFPIRRDELAELSSANNGQYSIGGNG